MEENKKMKFWSIVLLTINSIIGTGIFLSPGSVAKSTGTLAPWIYLCAAIFTSVMAITFSSAAKYVVKNGAGYAYSKAAFGENVGLYIGITRFVSASLAWGVMATGVVKTTLSIFSIDSENLQNITIGFLILMTILLIINIIGTKTLTFISDLSTIGKLLALSITIIAGIFILIKTGQNHISELDVLTNEAGEKLIPTLTTTGFVTAVIAAFYAFTGFESIASGASDMENPEKNLPRAIPLAIGIIAAIYFGIVLVSMFINPVAMVTSKEVVILASVFENKIISNIIIYGALISMFGINVAASFHTPRIFEAMARENQVPKFFDKRTEKGLPIRAFLLTAALAIIIPMAFNYNMMGIMIISSISRFIQFIIVPLGVISFYYGKNKEKVLDAKKNYLTDVIFPVISIILTVFLLAKFNWPAQFSIKNSVGEMVANWYAISAMIIGYIILPALLFVYKQVSHKK
ncbi:APC family permease [Leptotrichia sp. OH3620_COT-345]|uniref:APC family permease n=1 Tax=Leptotrichia sp. OH3620_COT-345 TaxID=2491048 RepID=UPI000F65388F|nr:APC family permease [Leptotrichia sp. OH3620_COT-345]RRD39123.1 APC family permease [Leptotrichia sp. OH3620_COT-345]